MQWDLAALVRHLAHGLVALEAVWKVVIQSEATLAVFFFDLLDVLWIEIQEH